MFESLRSVVYLVDDLDAAKQWYRGILRNDPILETSSVVHFKVGDCGLTLSHRKPSTPNPSRAVIAYWQVTDIDEDYRRLIAAGASPHTEINAAFGARRAIVADPFGNLLGLHGKTADMSGKTIGEEPSGTALIVASLRAMAAIDEREEIRGPDTLAQIFLTEDRQRVLHDPLARAWVMKNAAPPGMYEYLIARTAYFDAAVQQALGANIPQIVFLGAGYDSRPYRFRDLVRGTRIFEVDAPPTQERKRSLLAEKEIAPPPGHAFVPVHFEKDSLAECLAQAGYDAKLESLFVWEGVIYYLTEEAIDSTLKFMCDRSAKGSRLVLDYLATPERPVDAPVSSELPRAIRSSMPAEPFRFRIEHRELDAFLSQRGFHLVDHLTAHEMEDRYLRLRDGSSSGKILGTMGLATAET